MADHLANLLASFDATLPLAQARTIPNSWYFDPEIYEAERRGVFAGSWQMVGRLDAVNTPGAYLTAEIAGEPILVIRDVDGTLRGFHNVCRHRAAPLLNEACGTVTKLRCRYHGWTYDLTGRLRGTPEMDGLEQFCKEDNGLIPVDVATWGAWVWVHVDKSKQTIDEFLAPLPEWIQSRGLEKLQFVRRQEYELNCNWKVYVDNYLDGGYHVNTVHPALAGVLDYSEYRTRIYDRTSVQTSPIKAATDADPGAVKTRTGTEAAYWWVFPNFMLNLYEGVMDTNLVLPLGPARCRVIFDFYFADTQSDRARQYIDESIQVAHQVQKEDMGICEEVQKGLGSRSFSTGRFSVKRETAGYHFHQLLARSLQNALV